MPVYQSIGICISAAAGFLGLPKILDDVTNTARIQRKFEGIQRIADKAADGPRQVLLDKGADLGKQLASVYAVPSDPRAMVDLSLGITWLVIGAALLPIVVRDFEHHGGHSPFYWVLVYAGLWFTLRGLVRHRTVLWNRRLYIELDCPADPPLLKVPPLRRSLRLQRSVATVNRVLNKARAAFETNPDVGLAEHVRNAITELEQGKS
ncbi:hypothetical protein [Smaragdicoccus niigatensis]|uniref:hypothetical protein n=1 Tax=Smaragdicoccus niigatensis TaxID=359359 RepID=UPI00058E11EF|nr:hypothetical protein [Smaragdicoccus niigatensis]